LSIEIQLITKRKIPADIIRTFNRQTRRKFSMKILTRVKQPWNVKNLKLNFPLKVIPQKLFYSTGTRYGLCLARNELLSQAESTHVLVLDDYTLISPITVERLMRHLKHDLVVRGWKRKPKQPWKGPKQYDSFFSDQGQDSQKRV